MRISAIVSFPVSNRREKDASQFFNSVTDIRKEGKILE